MLKTKVLWVDESSRNHLENAKLLELEPLANAPFEWFEEPNERRGGWSGVARMKLTGPSAADQDLNVFLKIQKNHYYRSPGTLFRRNLTYKREFNALRRLESITDTLPRLLQFAEWQMNGDKYGLIITQSLDGWHPFDKWLASPESSGLLESCLEAIAGTLRQMHQKRWAHFGLFPKHVFVKQTDRECIRIKLIDFEKARQLPTREQCVIEDVSRFLRHTHALSAAEKKLFLECYFQTKHFSFWKKLLIRRMRGAPRI